MLRLKNYVTINVNRSEISKRTVKIFPLSIGYVMRLEFFIESNKYNTRE